MIDVLNLPSPEAGSATLVYAVGDIHGRLDCLKAMDALIAEDIKATPSERPLICYLGDYIDRGPDSAQVIDLLSRPRQDGTPTVFLRGNHEDRMIAFLEAPVAVGSAWLKFGGREALSSYGVDVPIEEETIDWPALHDRLLSLLPPTHLTFLRELRLAFRWRSFLFVHAGLNPARPPSMQEERDLMFIREPFLSSDVDFGCHVVHGHVIEASPVFRANRTGIDTGAYQTGTLTCLVVSDHERRTLQVSLGSLQ